MDNVLNSGSKMDVPIVELHATVRGAVQGVGFRYTTRQLALRLRLNGTVRNCSDGSVAIIAQGTREQVDALITQLKNTAGLGRIDAVETTFQRPDEILTSFQIVI